SAWVTRWCSTLKAFGVRGRACAPRQRQALSRSNRNGPKSHWGAAITCALAVMGGRQERGARFPRPLAPVVRLAACRCGGLPRLVWSALTIPHGGGPGEAKWTEGLPSQLPPASGGPASAGGSTRGRSRILQKSYISLTTFRPLSAILWPSRTWGGHVPRCTRERTGHGDPRPSTPLVAPPGLCGAVARRDRCGGLAPPTPGRTRAVRAGPP